MPIVEVRLVAGRSDEVKAALVSEVTDAVERTLGSAPERIKVLLSEYPSSHWNQAGVPLVVPCLGDTRG